MSTDSKSQTTEADDFEAGFAGHGRGVVISNDGCGRFSERPMTSAERDARHWALATSRGIDELYCRGAASFAYHRAWEYFAIAIAQARWEGWQAAVKRCTAEVTGCWGADLVTTQAVLDELLECRPE